MSGDTTAEDLIRLVHEAVCKLALGSPERKKRIRFTVGEQKMDVNEHYSLLYDILYVPDKKIRYHPRNLALSQKNDIMEKGIQLKPFKRLVEFAKNDDEIHVSENWLKLFNEDFFLFQRVYKKEIKEEKSYGRRIRIKRDNRKKTKTDFTKWLALFDDVVDDECFKEIKLKEAGKKFKFSKEDSDVEMDDPDDEMDDPDDEVKEQKYCEDYNISEEESVNESTEQSEVKKSFNDIVKNYEKKWLKYLEHELEKGAEFSIGDYIEMLKNHADMPFLSIKREVANFELGTKPQNLPQIKASIRKHIEDFVRKYLYIDETTRHEDVDKSVVQLRVIANWYKSTHKQFLSTLKKCPVDINVMIPNKTRCEKLRRLKDKCKSFFDIEDYNKEDHMKYIVSEDAKQIVRLDSNASSVNSQTSPESSSGNTKERKNYFLQRNWMMKIVDLLNDFVMRYNNLSRTDLLENLFESEEDDVRVLNNMSLYKLKQEAIEFLQKIKHNKDEAYLSSMTKQTGPNGTRIKFLEAIMSLDKCFNVEELDYEDCYYYATSLGKWTHSILEHENFDMRIGTKKMGIVAGKMSENSIWRKENSDFEESVEDIFGVFLSCLKRDKSDGRNDVFYVEKPDKSEQICLRDDKGLIIEDNKIRSLSLVDSRFYNINIKSWLTMFKGGLLEGIEETFIKNFIRDNLPESDDKETLVQIEYEFINVRLYYIYDNYGTLETSQWTGRLKHRADELSGILKKYREFEDVIKQNIDEYINYIPKDVINAEFQGKEVPKKNEVMKKKVGENYFNDKVIDTHFIKITKWINALPPNLLTGLSNELSIAIENLDDFGIEERVKRVQYMVINYLYYKKVSIQSNTLPESPFKINDESVEQLYNSLKKSDGFKDEIQAKLADTICGFLDISSSNIFKLMKGKSLTNQIDWVAKLYGKRLCSPEDVYNFYDTWYDDSFDHAVFVEILASVWTMYDDVESVSGCIAYFINKKEIFNDDESKEYIDTGIVILDKLWNKFKKDASNRERKEQLQVNLETSLYQKLPQQKYKDYQIKVEKTQNTDDNTDKNILVLSGRYQDFEVKKMHYETFEDDIADAESLLKGMRVSLSSARGRILDFVCHSVNDIDIVLLEDGEGGAHVVKKHEHLKLDEIKINIQYHTCKVIKRPSNSTDNSRLILVEEDCFIPPYSEYNYDKEEYNLTRKGNNLSLRLASWNVACTNGFDRPRTMEEFTKKFDNIATVIIRSRCDIVALQELPKELHLKESSGKKSTLTFDDIESKLKEKLRTKLPGSEWEMEVAEVFHKAQGGGDKRKENTPKEMYAFVYNKNRVEYKEPKKQEFSNILEDRRDKDERFSRLPQIGGFKSEYLEFTLCNVHLPPTAKKTKACQEIRNLGTIAFEEIVKEAVGGKFKNSVIFLGDFNMSYTRKKGFLPYPETDTWETFFENEYVPCIKTFTNVVQNRCYDNIWMHHSLEKLRMIYPDSEDNTGVVKVNEVLGYGPIVSSALTEYFKREVSDHNLIYIDVRNNENMEWTLKNPVLKREKK